MLLKIVQVEERIISQQRNNLEVLKSDSCDPAFDVLFVE